MANETKLTVILHADIVGSTALVRIDERSAHDRIQDVFTRFSDLIIQHNGGAHEVRGDAIVAKFERASDAVVAALAFQSANIDYNFSLDDEIRPELRIGIAMGEVVIAPNTITGVGVVLAQRLEQLAEAGGVIISAAIREALPDRLPVICQDLGERELKGFERPQRVYVARNTADEVQAEIPSKGPEALTSAATEQRRASIAVLPFLNLGTDSDDEFFADGMTEDITTALSKFKQLTVIARGTTFSLKGKSVDVVLTARDLNVRYVVDGSIRRIGGRIRASAQLIDGSTGTQIWAERFDRNVEDVFAVQDELTEAITVSVAPQIARTEQVLARRTHPTSLDAWSLLQTALSKMMEDTSDALRDAEELMRRACALDPGYAAAFAWAAFNRSQRIVFGAAVDSTLDVDEAVAWAERAVELDKDDPVCQMALGRALMAKGNLERSLRSLDRAVALNPNFAFAYVFLGVARLLRGEPDIALVHANIAVRLCPSDAWGARAFLAKSAALRMLRRIEESIEAGTVACDLAPAMYMTHALLAASLGLANQVEEGLAAWRRALVLEPDLTPAGLIERRRNANPLMRDTLQEGWARLGIL